MSTTLQPVERSPSAAAATSSAVRGRPSPARRTEDWEIGRFGDSRIWTEDWNRCRFALSTPCALALSSHHGAERGGDVLRGGGGQIVQIDAAGPFVVEQRSRLASPTGFGQLGDAARARACRYRRGAGIAGRPDRTPPAARDAPPARSGAARRGNGTDRLAAMDSSAFTGGRLPLLSMPLPADRRRPIRRPICSRYCRSSEAWLTFITPITSRHCRSETSSPRRYHSSLARMISSADARKNRDDGVRGRRCRLSRCVQWRRDRRGDSSQRIRPP